MHTLFIHVDYLDTSLFVFFDTKKYVSFQIPVELSIK